MRNILRRTPKWSSRLFVLAASFGALLGLAGSGRGAPQCPLVRYDTQNTGRSSFVATHTPSLEWVRTVNASAGPVIGEDGTLYYGAYDRTIYARASDGTVRWTYRTETIPGNSPALGTDGTIYFGITGQLIALDSSGNRKWLSPFRLTSWANPSPATVGRDGTIYVGADDNCIYAVNPDGTLKWSCRTGGVIRQGLSMSPDGSTIYAVAGDGRIYAVDSNGSIRWKSNVISPTYNCAVGDDGTIYAGSSTGIFYALNPDGTQKWKFQAQSKITCAAGIAADGTVYFGSQDANFYALDTNGQIKWIRRTGGSIYSAPAIDAKGTVIFSAWPGELTAVDPASGSVLWTQMIGTTIYSSASIASDGSIYVLVSDGKLYKYSGPTHPEPSSLLACSSLLAGVAYVNLRRRRRHN